MAAQSLVVRDGNAIVRSLQVNSGSAGYIPNHSLVATAEDTDIKMYFPNPNVGLGETGWTWGTTDSNVFVAAAADSDRKGVVIHNNSSLGQIYLLLGNTTFGNNPDQSKAPVKYTALIEPGATYFGDTLTCSVAHKIYAVSGSTLTNAEAITVSVTEIY